MAILPLNKGTHTRRPLPRGRPVHFAAPATRQPPPAVPVVPAPHCAIPRPHRVIPTYHSSFLPPPIVIPAPPPSSFLRRQESRGAVRQGATPPPPHHYPPTLLATHRRGASRIPITLRLVIAKACRQGACRGRFAKRPSRESGTPTLRPAALDGPHSPIVVPRRQESRGAGSRDIPSPSGGRLGWGSVPPPHLVIPAKAGTQRRNGR